MDLKGSLLEKGRPIRRLCNPEMSVTQRLKQGRQIPEIFRRQNWPVQLLIEYGGVSLMTPSFWLQQLAGIAIH